MQTLDLHPLAAEFQYLPIAAIGTNKPIMVIDSKVHHLDPTDSIAAAAGKSLPFSMRLHSVRWWCIQQGL